MVYTFVLSPSPIEGGFMEGKIYLGKYPLIKQRDMVWAIDLPSEYEAFACFKEWANENYPIEQIIFPDEINWTIDYIIQQMAMSDEKETDYEELLIETIKAIAPPEEGENWLAIDLKGRVSYHNRKPVPISRGADVAYGNPPVGCWVTWEHNRNIFNTGEVKEWRSHLYKIGDYPLKQYNH